MVETEVRGLTEKQLDGGQEQELCADTLGKMLDRQ